MPVAVVEMLEVVHVAENDRVARAVALGAHVLGPERELEGAHVPEAGELVGDREGFELGVLLLEPSRARSRAVMSRMMTWTARSPPASWIVQISTSKASSEPEIFQRSLSCSG